MKVNTKQDLENILPSLGELSKEEVNVLKEVKKTFIACPERKYVCNVLADMSTKAEAVYNLLNKIDYVLEGKNSICLDGYLENVLNTASLNGEEDWSVLVQMSKNELRILWLDKLIKENTRG